MSRGHYKPRRPKITMEHVPRETADMIHARCEPILNHWGAHISTLGIDSLVLSIYTQGMMDGVQVAERSFGARIEDGLPEPEPELTSEVSSA